MARINTIVVIIATTLIIATLCIARSIESDDDLSMAKDFNLRALQDALLQEEKFDRRGYTCSPSACNSPCVRSGNGCACGSGYRFSSGGLVSKSYCVRSRGRRDLD